MATKKPPLDFNVTPQQLDAEAASVDTSAFNGIEAMSAAGQAANLSDLSSGNANLTSRPGFVLALQQGQATVQQAQAIDQFMTAQDAANQLKLAQQSNSPIQFNQTQIRALAAVGIDPGPNAQAPDSAQASAQFGQSVDTQLNQNAQQQAKIANQQQAKGMLSWNPWTDFKSAMGYLSPKPVIGTAITGVNDAWNWVDSTVSSPQDKPNIAVNPSNPGLQRVQQGTSPVEENYHLAQLLGYDPNNAFSMAAFKASGHEVMDITDLVNKYGQDKVDQAYQFMSNPDQYIRSIADNTNLTVQQKSDQLTALYHDKDMQDLTTLLKARGASIGDAVTLGIDPLKHPELQSRLSGVVDTAASFAMDPTMLVGKGLKILKGTELAMSRIGSAEKMRQWLTTDNRLWTPYSNQARRAVQQTIDSSTIIRDAVGKGDIATAAGEYARFKNLNTGLEQLLPDFIGATKAGHLDENLAKVIGGGTGAPITTMEDAANYLADTVGKARLSLGYHASDPGLFPGQLSKYGAGAVIRNLRASAAAITVAHGINASADGILDLNRVGEAAKVLATFSDRMDPTTGQILASPEEAAKAEEAMTEMQSAMRARNNAAQAAGESQYAAMHDLSWSGAANRFKMTAQRMFSTLPRGGQIEFNIADPNSTKLVEQFGRFFLSNSSASGFAARYAAGDENVRKAIVHGLGIQTMYAAGLGTNEIGRALIEKYKQAFENHMFGVTNAPIEDIETGATRDTALWGSQAADTLTLPSFSELQKLAAKTGLWSATGGRALNNQVVDVINGMTKLGWQGSGASVLRNAMDDWTNAFAKGEFGSMLQAKVAGRAGLPNRTKTMNFLLKPLGWLGSLYRKGVFLTATATAKQRMEAIASLVDTEEGKQILSDFSKSISDHMIKGMVDPGGTQEATEVVRNGYRAKRFILKGYESVSAPAERGFDGQKMVDDIGAHRLANQLGHIVGGNPDVVKAILNEMEQGGELLPRQAAAVEAQVEAKAVDDGADGAAAAAAASEKPAVEAAAQNGNGRPIAQRPEAPAPVAPTASFGDAVKWAQARTGKLTEYYLAKGLKITPAEAGEHIGDMLRHHLIEPDTGRSYKFVGTQDMVDQATVDRSQAVLDAAKAWTGNKAGFSASYIQRKLSMGYASAHALLGQMYRQGRLELTSGEVGKQSAIYRVPEAGAAKPAEAAAGAKVADPLEQAIHDARAKLGGMGTVSTADLLKASGLSEKDFYDTLDKMSAKDSNSGGVRLFGGKDARNSTRVTVYKPYSLPDGSPIPNGASGAAKAATESLNPHEQMVVNAWRGTDAHFQNSAFRSLKDIRENLARQGMSRADQDAAFKSLLNRNDGFRMVPVADGGKLTKEERAAGLKVGNSNLTGMHVPVDYGQPWLYNDALKAASKAPKDGFTAEYLGKELDLNASDARQLLMKMYKNGHVSLANGQAGLDDARYSLMKDGRDAIKSPAAPEPAKAPVFPAKPAAQRPDGIGAEKAKAAAPAPAATPVDTSHLKGFNIQNIVDALKADPRTRTMSRANQYVVDTKDAATGQTKQYAVKAVTDQEKQVALTQLAYAQTRELRFLLSDSQGSLNKAMVDHIRNTGAAPDSKWISQNLPDTAMRPKSVLAPQWEAVVHDLHSGKGVAQAVAGALMDLTGMGYQYVIDRPIRRLSTTPIFLDNYGRFKIENEYWKKQLLASGMSEQTAERFAVNQALQQAMNRTLKYIDDPTLRTQMDVVGRNFFAYSRATRAFLQRWGTNFVEDPSRIRKVMLAYEGGVKTGMIYKDQNGNSQFVFPGSGAAANALMYAADLVPGVDLLKFPQLKGDLSGGMQFLSPGLQNPMQMSLSPVMNFPLRSVEAMFPNHSTVMGHIAEALQWTDDHLNGTVGQNTGWFNRAVAQNFPTAVKKFTDALSSDDINSLVADSVRGALLAMSAAEQLPGQKRDKQGNPIAADSASRQQFIDQLRTQAKGQLFIRALFGLFDPATPGIPNEAAGANGQTGGASDAPDWFAKAEGARNLDDEYKMMLNQFSGDVGLTNAWWAQNHPDKMMYTVPSTTASAKSAVFNATQASMNWIGTHTDFFNKYSQVAAYFLPPADNLGPFDLSAYNAEMQLGVRSHKDYATYYNDLATANASREYWSMLQQRNQQLAANADQYWPDPATGKMVKASTVIGQQWSTWNAQFNSLNPLWAQARGSYSDAVATAQNQMQELHNMVANPKSVPSDIDLKAVKDALDAYATYHSMVSKYKSGTAADTAARKSIGAQYSQWWDDTLFNNPWMGGLYTGVFRSLDTSVLDPISTQGAA